MKLGNFGYEDHASMYFVKSNDSPMRNIYCPYCSKHMMRINYNIAEMTNTSGVTLEQAHVEAALIINWRCRGCHCVWQFHFMSKM